MIPIECASDYCDLLCYDIAILLMLVHVHELHVRNWKF